MTPGKKEWLDISPIREPSPYKCLNIYIRAGDWWHLYVIISSVPFYETYMKNLSEIQLAASTSLTCQYGASLDILNAAEDNRRLFVRARGNSPSNLRTTERPHYGNPHQLRTKLRNTDLGRAVFTVKHVTILAYIRHLSLELLSRRPVVGVGRSVVILRTENK